MSNIERRNLVQVVVTKSVDAGSTFSADLTVTILKTVTLPTTTPSSATDTPEVITYYTSQTDQASETASGSITSMLSLSLSLSLASSVSASTLLALSHALSNASSLSSVQGLSSGSDLGIAIGIPIAAVFFFGLCIFFVVYLRKKYGTSPSDLLTFKDPGKKSAGRVGQDLEKGVSENFISGSESLESSEKSLSKESHSKRVRPPKLSLANRLSKIINVPETPMELKSAVFLRRFNLMKKDALEKDLPSSPATMTQAKEGKLDDSLKLHVVVRPYARRLQDELTVCAGEKVTVLKVHSDGWVTVKRHDDGKIGVIPLLCIQRLGDVDIQP